MSATTDKVDTVGVLGTVERMITGPGPYVKDGFLRPIDRFRSRPKPRVVRRKLLKGRAVRQWGRPTSADDPLWRIVGMAGFDLDRPTDVSADKHKYLAEAYAAVAAE